MVVNAALSNTDLSKSSGYEEPTSNHFYEGVEKLLEIWFTKSDKLRKILNEQVWRDMIFPLVECTILNRSSDEFQDAYVLSESSCFVTDERVILKTCGTTKCLQALPVILEILESNNNDEIEPIAVYYSRKNFINPIEQPPMYRGEHFQDEYEYLDNMLVENFDSKALCLGNLQSNKWFFYQAVRKNREDISGESDQTLEILMTELDEETMSQFFAPNHHKVTKTLNLDRLVPGAIKHDDYAFDHCGYSSNTILSQPGGYVTMHVTPEREHSFVSFETNYAGGTEAIVERVLATFKPGACSVSLVANRGSEARATLNRWAAEELGEGRLAKFEECAWLSERDKQVCCLADGYKLVYKYYSELKRACNN